jgi:AcrR family transcriptional regulator
MTIIMKAASDRKTQTHERILDVAARAIRRGGYHGVGVADIMKEAGLTHGGFYAHFASRDAMLVEAMQQAGGASALRVAGQLAEREARGESSFAALVNIYLHDTQLGSTESGCVVAALASEMPRQAEPLLSGARERVQHLIRMVRDAMPEGSPDDAAVVAATMVGALTLARTLGGRGGRSLLASTRASLHAQYGSAAG